MIAQGAAPGMLPHAPGRLDREGNVCTVAERGGAGKVPPKWTRTLHALLQRPRLDRFEAERDPAIRDHTLPSTVADLQRKGLRVDRRIVKRPGFGGGIAMVAEYTLPADQHARALQLLEAADASHHAAS